MKLGKYILVLSALAAGLAGCVHDEPVTPVIPVDPGTEASTTLTFAVPSDTFGGATRAAGSEAENAIYCLDLFLINMSHPDRVVDEYIRITDVTEILQAGDYSTFRLDLSEFENGSNYKIILFANGVMPVQYGDMIGLQFNPHFGGKVLGVTTENELIRDIRAQFPTDPVAGGLTMWGETEQTFTLPSEIPTIQMIRACARFDVTLDPSLTGILDIQEVRVENMNGHFYFSPYAGEIWEGSGYKPRYNYNHATLKVAHASPYHSTIVPRPLVANGNGTFSGYVTEHGIGSDQEEEMVLIIKCKYGPAQAEGYYKIRLLDQGGEQFEILRNHLYTVNITGVTGPGYELDELDNINTYLQAEVREWDDTPQRTIFDGEYYLKISKSDINVGKEPGWTYIDFETNFPGTGDKSGKDLDNMAPGIVLNNITGTFFHAANMIPVDDGDGNPHTTRYKLSWGDYIDDARSFGMMHVMAGNMKVTMIASQSSDSWLQTPGVVYAPMNGGFYDFAVRSSMHYNGDYRSANYWELDVEGDGADKYIPVTTSLDNVSNPSSNSSDTSVIYFKTVNLPGDIDSHDVRLVFRTTDKSEYHYDRPVTMPVYICNAGEVNTGNTSGYYNMNDRMAQSSNCFIVPPGGTVYIPLVNAGYSEYINTLSVLDRYTEVGKLGYTVVWSDRVGNFREMGLVGTKVNDGYLRVKVGANPGNMVVAVTSPRTVAEEAQGIPEADVIRWSWHLWITDYDPYPTAQVVNNPHGGPGTGRADVTVMDRALGALASDPGDPVTADSFRRMEGLFYQAGRKDPFPQDIPIYGGLNMAPVAIESGDIGNDHKKSVMYPLRPSRGEWTQYPYSNSSKPLRDPCPPGWKLPNYFDNWTSEYQGQGLGYKDIQPYLFGATIGRVPSDTSLWWMYWPGYGGYFAGGRGRLASNFDVVDNSNLGSMWPGSVGGYSNYQSYRFSFSDTGRRDSSVGMVPSANGYNVRCVEYIRNSTYY